ncbi:MAG: TIGR03790 family protein [Bacteroidetes bacterium]|nr:TIGR03790 family protein [Bacteroidota bacterium]
MLPRIGTLLLLLVCTAFVAAQTSTYHDVVVIINSNSPQSDSIGSYFAAQRCIHPENIIRLALPLTEEISDPQFALLRKGVEDHLTLYGIQDSINYIVTTKGVPLKVKRQDGWYSSSVESELSLLLGPYAGSIGGNGRITSPYYGKRGHFTRMQYGIYLVTRLDGYTVADVVGLIDRSAVIPNGPPTSGKFVLDMDPGWNTAAPYLNTRMSVAADTMRRRGLSCLLDSTNVYLTGQQQVNGYAGWGSNDKHTSQYGRLNFTWNPGAIAETYVSTSARTFTKPVVYGQSLIADIIAEGVTAAKGYVYEPYASAMADVSILFDLYTQGYTVAESYASASPFLSWMDVVIGDPKYRLTDDRLPDDPHPVDTGDEGEGLPVEFASFTAMVNGKGVMLVWSTATEQNNLGFEVEKMMSGTWSRIGFVEGHGTTNAPHSYTFTDATAKGRVLYRLKQIDRDGKFEYTGSVEAFVEPAITAYALGQNYPNPFNPVSSIRYQLPRAGTVSLKVYDMLGKEVAVLVNGPRPAGDHTVRFNASNLPTGVYLYTLRTLSFSQTRKMMYLR